MSKEADIKEMFDVLLETAEEIRLINQAIIKKKLKIIKNSNIKEIIEKTKPILDIQINELKKVRELFLSLTERSVIKDFMVSMSSQKYVPQEIESILDQVFPILNSLITNIFSQKNVLENNKYSDIEKVLNYKKYFHEEFSIYKTYGVLGRQLIKERNLVKNTSFKAIKAKGGKYFRKETLKNIATIFVLSFFFDYSADDFLIIMTLLSTFEIVKVLYSNKKEFEKIELAAKAFNNI